LTSIEPFSIGGDHLPDGRDRSGLRFECLERHGSRGAWPCGRIKFETNGVARSKREPVVRDAWKDGQRTKKVAPAAIALFPVLLVYGR
jgi:hypothetical protein